MVTSQYPAIVRPRGLSHGNGVGLTNRYAVGWAGGARALSRLVEEALRAQIFEKSVERVKGTTAGVSPAKLQGIVNEAVRYARRAR